MLLAPGAPFFKCNKGLLGSGRKARGIFPNCRGDTITLTIQKRNSDTRDNMRRARYLSKGQIKASDYVPPNVPQLS